MDELSQIYAVLKTGWLVALFVLFLALLVWVLAPSQKSRMERNARIPLDGDEKD